jgi:hypothetical protein
VSLDQRHVTLFRPGVTLFARHVTFLPPHVTFFLSHVTVHVTLDVHHRLRKELTV